MGAESQGMQGPLEAGNDTQPTASKETGTSVLQQQGLNFANVLNEQGNRSSPRHSR